VLVLWNNWNIDIPSFVLKYGIIFQLWNNLSTGRNIPDKKLFHACQYAQYRVRCA
jgi:hypothetical protein